MGFKMSFFNRLHAINELFWRGAQRHWGFPSTRLCLNMTAHVCEFCINIWLRAHAAHPVKFPHRWKSFYGLFKTHVKYAFDRDGELINNLTFIVAPP